MILGVDLSTHNKNVDYKELKKNGVEFAFIRTGYGKDENQKDAMFETHYKGCIDAGIKVGAYLYSYCTSVENAEKEAYNCLSHIQGKKFNLPIFYDLEEQRTANLGIDAVTQIALTFCKRIRDAGFKSGVYANLNWFRNYIRPDAIKLEKFYIWLAQWGNEITANFPIDIWQFTNNLDNLKIDGNYIINNELLYVENVNNNVEKNIKELAVDVIFGKYGNGNERKEKLGKYYNEVQEIVNKIYEILGDKK